MSKKFYVEYVEYGKEAFDVPSSTLGHALCVAEYLAELAKSKSAGKTILKNEDAVSVKIPDGGVEITVWKHNPRGLDEDFLRLVIL